MDKIPIELNPMLDDFKIEKESSESYQTTDNLYGYEGDMFGYENANDDYLGMPKFYHEVIHCGYDNRNHEENYSDSNVARMSNNYQYSFARENLG